MKIEELEIGKIYIYRNTEPLVFKHYPSSSCSGFSSFKFETIEAKPKAIYLDHQAVNNSITEVKAEKPEVPNFRPDHYTSLPFKLDEVQETIAENCFKATGDFKKALWVSFALKHLGRLGLKDNADLELKKAENYLHKARTGEWLND